MPRVSTADVITEQADLLFYQQGFEATSFADIAGEVGISRGNFYYHFKTKDEILDAVISRRMSDTQAKLDNWSTKDEAPAGRIRGFINILITNRAKIMAHGCPVGTLCSELSKLDHQAEPRATEIFTLFRDWLAGQFRELGCPEPDMLAMHLLARSQGIATLANAFHDETFVRHEVDQLYNWLESVTPAVN